MPTGSIRFHSYFYNDQKIVNLSSKSITNFMPLHLNARFINSVTIFAPASIKTTTVPTTKRVSCYHLTVDAVMPCSLTTRIHAASDSTIELYVTCPVRPIRGVYRRAGSIVTGL